MSTIGYTRTWMCPMRGGVWSIVALAEAIVLRGPIVVGQQRVFALPFTSRTSCREVSGSRSAPASARSPLAGSHTRNPYCSRMMGFTVLPFSLSSAAWLISSSR